MKTLLFISLFISVTSCKYIAKGAATLLEGYKIYNNSVTKNKNSQINSPNKYNYKRLDVLSLNNKLRQRMPIVLSLKHIKVAVAIEHKFFKFFNISAKKHILDVKCIDLILTKLDKDKTRPFTKEEIEYLKISKLIQLKRLKDKK